MVPMVELKEKNKMKQEEVFRIQMELELLKEGFYDEYISDYMSVKQNHDKMEKDFEHKLYERTSEHSKRRTKYEISWEILRKWWYMQKRPELFDEKLKSKFD